MVNFGNRWTFPQSLPGLLYDDKPLIESGNVDGCSIRITGPLSHLQKEERCGAPMEDDKKSAAPLTVTYLATNPARQGGPEPLEWVLSAGKSQQWAESHCQLSDS